MCRFASVVTLAVLLLGGVASASPLDASVHGGVVIDEETGFTAGVDYDVWSWREGVVAVGLRAMYVPIENESVDAFADSVTERWFQAIPTIGHRFDLVQDRIGLGAHVGVGWWFQPSSYDLEGGESGPIQSASRGGFSPTMIARADLGIAGPVFLGAEYTLPLGLPQSLEHLRTARNGFFSVSLRLAL